MIYSLPFKIDSTEEHLITIDKNFLVLETKKNRFLLPFAKTNKKYTLLSEPDIFSGPLSVENHFQYQGIVKRITRLYY